MKLGGRARESGWEIEHGNEAALEGQTDNEARRESTGIRLILHLTKEMCMEESPIISAAVSCQTLCSYVLEFFTCLNLKYSQKLLLCLVPMTDTGNGGHSDSTYLWLSRVSGYLASHFPASSPRMPSLEGVGSGGHTT